MTAGAKSQRSVLYFSAVKISTLPVIMATINQGTAIYKKNRDSFLNTSWQVLITRLQKAQEKYFAFSWQKMTAERKVAEKCTVFFRSKN